ncbi:MAG TPA: aldehyde dehydrogenase family protein [Acidimicrobiia bacterium]|nr:aldehyde dehydrogenase family protein [Acidimicrobiia bacterium]
MTDLLTSLEPGMPIVYGGNRVVTVEEELAAAFTEGDRLVVVQDTGALLHIPAEAWETAVDAVGAASAAFARMGSVGDDQITSFFEGFAARLEDDSAFAPIAAANDADVERAQARSRSTTRLVLTEKMRHGMIEGLRSWAHLDLGRGRVVEKIDHEGWSLAQVRAGLGVVGFVSEGRPNVFADATGLLAAGNTIVFRIGSDALETARAIMSHALRPALGGSGLPEGAVSLVDNPSRAAGWAMFSDTRLALAVARGSGAAVSQLGSVARQAGIPVSLHGTGGAWLVAAGSADPEVFAAAIFNSLDRKVCNTLNTVCIVESRATDLIPIFLESLHQAGERLGATSKLHVTPSAGTHLPEAWFEPAAIVRSGGPITEPRTEEISEDSLGVEWEWEGSPEVTLTVVPDVDTATDLFNTHSPRFVASLVSETDSDHERFFERVDAPFVGNGFTRWVDGQYALDLPELGLSNWQFGRLFGRGGVLSGDSVYTIRTRVHQTDPGIGR